MTALVLPGMTDAWKKPVVLKMISIINRAGIAVAIGTPGARTQLLIQPDGSQRTVKVSAPDADGMQWCEDDV